MTVLEKIGFYTLSDERARTSSETSPLARCELILTGRCNFKCPYCRGLRTDLGLSNDLSFEAAQATLELWIAQGLQNVRFSGGEPTLWPGLVDLVKIAHKGDVQRIAVSTNGSASIETYVDLWRSGVNDFSISLDSDCCSTSEKMTGGVKSFNHVLESIKTLSQLTYVTVGMVFTEQNIDDCVESIIFVSSLGVSDIRIIPSAQFNRALSCAADALPNPFLDQFPILAYRVRNICLGKHVRGLRSEDSGQCRLALDDMIVAGDYHFPCVIYMREGGDPIGKIGPRVRQERAEWVASHDAHRDPICREMCLDVCIDFNNVANENNFNFVENIDQISARQI